MSVALFFLVKYFPVWSVMLILVFLPFAYNLYRLRKRIASMIVLVFVLVLFIALYFYIAYDGYNNAVNFVRQFFID